MIKEFNKSTLTLARTEITAALKEIGAKLGIDLSLGNISYATDGLSFHTKLSAKVASAEAVIIGEEKANQGLAFYGLAINTKLKMQGRDFVVVGYDPKKRLKSLQIKDLNNGQIYISNPQNAKHYIVK